MSLRSVLAEKHTITRKVSETDPGPKFPLTRKNQGKHRSFTPSKLLFFIENSFLIFRKIEILKIFKQQPFQPLKNKEKVWNERKSQKRNEKFNLFKESRKRIEIFMPTWRTFYEILIIQFKDIIILNLSIMRAEKFLV